MQKTNILKETLDMPIEELTLSDRTYNCLKKRNINTVRGLLKLEREDLSSWSFNIADKRAKEIEKQLSLLAVPGLHLGMKDELDGLGFLTVEEIEELEKRASLITSLEGEKQKLNIIVRETKKNNNKLSDLIETKKAMLQDLQALSEEQECLKAENESLDAQISQFIAILGLEKTYTNKEMNNDGKKL